jgi:hypothetical protein
MARIISALILAVTAACAFAAEPLKLVDNPPDRHIVVPGDTLWGISGKFLKQPWRWPEVWRMNQAEIKNPHLIYPGDIVLLDHFGGNPRLKIAKPMNNKLQPKIYSEAVQQAIPSIPPNIIEPYISQPLIIEAGRARRPGSHRRHPGRPPDAGQWRHRLCRRHPGCEHRKVECLPPWQAAERSGNR